MFGGTLPRHAQSVIQIDNNTVAVRLHFGVWVVVPTWNVDVAIGMILDGVIEPWTARAVQRILKPGDTYVNVGANFGFYMALGAHAVGYTGKVIAVEANPVLLPYLKRSMFWSRYSDVIRLFNRAASDVDNETLRINFDAQFIGGASVALPDDPSALPGSTIEDSLWQNIDPARFVHEDGSVSPTQEGVRVRRECRTARLDTMLKDLERVDLLHMDIEGSEPAAIAGAHELIRRSPGIVIIMEWSPHYCLSPSLLEKTCAMWDFFQDMGYAWYRIRHEDFRPGLRAPRLSAIERRDDLFATPHSDVMVVKDLRAAFGRWPRVVDDRKKKFRW